jgi:hypothetical protein
LDIPGELLTDSLMFGGGLYAINRHVPDFFYKLAFILVFGDVRGIVSPAIGYRLFIVFHASHSFKVK